MVAVRVTSLSSSRLTRHASLARVVFIPGVSDRALTRAQPVTRTGERPALSSSTSGVRLVLTARVEDLVDHVDRSVGAERKVEVAVRDHVHRGLGTRRAADRDEHPLAPWREDAERRGKDGRRSSATQKNAQGQCPCRIRWAASSASSRPPTRYGRSSRRRRPTAAAERLPVELVVRDETRMIGAARAREADLEHRRPRSCPAPARRPGTPTAAPSTSPAGQENVYRAVNPSYTSSSV